VSTKIRLKRFGAKGRPYYRIVVMDTRSARDSKTIEELGYYQPIENKDQQVKLDEEKIKRWIENGAKPSATVKQILNKNNINLK